jgi:hypothetical protein
MHLKNNATIQELGKKSRGEFVIFEKIFVEKSFPQCTLKNVESLTYPRFLFNCYLKLVVWVALHELWGQDCWIALVHSVAKLKQVDRDQGHHLF